MIATQLYVDVDLRCDVNLLAVGLGQDAMVEDASPSVADTHGARVHVPPKDYIANASDSR